MRGIYGGAPREMVPAGGRLVDQGVNAIFVGSGGINDELVTWAREQGVKLYAEFNTMHAAEYLKDHPDAAPVGVDGQPCPPPDGWQGVAPAHEGYRRWRMDALRELVARVPIDGVWLDYHHSQANWEQPEPAMPDTGFEPYSLARFQQETGITLPAAPVTRLARLLLTTHRERWIRWRCDVFTDWVREIRAILDATRPGLLLGTFHCPWSDTDRDGALRNKLCIDLKAQARYLDVFSPMPYHARFGHATDPAWISRQVTWLGGYLGIRGEPGERHRIWPIVQLADWGETVAAGQVAEVLDHGSRRPATGVMVFHWSGLAARPEKIPPLREFYLAIGGAAR
ncbi:MAG: family 10 glycosylhydrolase [Armatimonadetes bacterium]|nr:family 10 glycosylhydrolase [Armatimonadota bacterium]